MKNVCKAKKNLNKVNYIEKDLAFRPNKSQGNFKCYKQKWSFWSSVEAPRSFDQQQPLFNLRGNESQPIKYKV